MATSERRPVYEFGGFYLDTRRRMLFKADGERLPLTSRAFDTLAFMAEHPGDLLDTDRLMDAIWPDVTVEENNLQQIITALRRALGEKPGDHRFIVTSRGRGYHFVAPVKAVSCPPGETGPAWRRSIAWAGALLAAVVLAAFLATAPQSARQETGGHGRPVAINTMPRAG